MTAVIHKADAKARKLVRLADGREGVLAYWPPDGEGRAKVIVGGLHFRIPAAEVVEVIERPDPTPLWAIHERLLTLVRLLGEQGDPSARGDVVTLQRHRPGRRTDQCHGCGHFWPCPEVHALGERRAFHW